MNHKIHALSLNKFRDHSVLRNEFLIMSFAEFNDKLQSDSHFKNKFYPVLIFHDAAGSMTIDNQEFDLKPRKFFFINYNQVYHIKGNHNITGDVILFTKSFYNFVYTGNKVIKSDTALNSVSPVILPAPENQKDLLQTFKELQDEYCSSKLLKKETICLLLKVFMLKYIRNSKKSRIDRSLNHKKEITEDFGNLVNHHYKEWKTTSKYAEKLSLTPNYLNVLVKEHLDITAGQVIKNRVILEAERLLLHTTLSVTEISYELGFNDNSHFGKYFKSVKNTSPKTYRLLKIADP